MNKLVWIVILVVISFVVGMMSPGQWLTDRGWELKKLYYQFRLGNVPIAENFVSNPFGLKLVYVKNATTGKLETYLTNTQTNELLPVYEIDKTTQVGNMDHRLHGVRAEAQKTIEKGGKTALDKLKQLQELFK